MAVDGYDEERPPAEEEHPLAYTLTALGLASTYATLAMAQPQGQSPPCRLCFDRLLPSQINSYGIMNLPLLNLYLRVFHRGPQESPLAPVVLRFVLSLPKPPHAWRMSSLNVLFQPRPAGG
jgi:hypothetical protein